MITTINVVNVPSPHMDLLYSTGNSTQYSVIANYMCQLVLIMGCPDVWLNITSGCVCEGVSRGD